MGVKVREKPKGSNNWWIFIDHNGRRAAKKVGPKFEAVKVADIIRGRLAQGKGFFPQEPKPKRLPTLDEYYERFKNNVLETSLKPTTYESYERSFRLHLLPKFGKMRLDQIDRVMIQAFVADLVKKTRERTLPDGEKVKEPAFARDSIRLILAALGILYVDAIEESKLPVENPTVKMGKFYRQAPVKHEYIEPLTPEESIKLLETMSQNNLYKRYYPLLLCALHTGMRSGELAGLQWEDVDWQGKYLWVRRNIVNGRISDLKTKNSRRKVDCSDELLATLNELKRTRQEEALKEGEEMSEWIFTNTANHFVDMRNIKRRYFKPAIKKAGLRMIRFHDLRHTYASLLLSQGEPVLYVSNQLGHSDAKVTLEVYAKWIPNESQRNAVNRLPSLRTATA